MFTNFAVFKIREHNKNSEQKMKREQEIMHDAINNLKRLTGVRDITFQHASQSEYDYDITINGISFVCEVKTLINKANFNLALKQMESLREKTAKPRLLVVQHIVPDLFDRFASEGISVAESNGNCNINVSPLFIRICGQKTVLPREQKGKAFNEAGLKLIFYFMLDDENINKPYRRISEETGFSLGTIKNVVEELGEKYFVIKTSKGRFLKNKKELLDTWQTYYNQTLKPKLLMKELEFADIESRKEWKNINLPKDTCWGGEGGAYLLDGYLIPEKFDLYTDVPSIKIVMGNKIRYQENGSIRLYQKFWDSETDDKVAPRILLYADLMGSGNSRCIEAAQRLVENGI